MVKKLHNSLVEFVVLAGFDNYTGLISTNTQTQEINKQNIFENTFEPSVLSVISHDKAYYPSSKDFNLDYPHIKFNKNDLFNSSNENSDNVDNVKNERNNLRRRKNSTMMDSPIQHDILENLCQFCFPNTISVLKENVESSVHSFVITDIEGRKKYAIVLTYSREFYSCKNEFDENYELIPVNDDEDLTEENKSYNLVYVPTCIVLISKFFYYDLLKNCVSSIYDSLVERPNEINLIIESYTFELTHIPVPPVALKRLNLVLEYKLMFQQISIHPLDEFGFDSYGLDLSILFKIFGVDEIIEIILFLLVEQKILFISENNGLLTPIIQLFLRLLSPFKWMLPFVPLLPSSLIEYIEAPHPFIMGLNSKYIELINKENDVIIINIDMGALIVPDSVRDSIINFPETNITLIKRKLSEVSFNNVQNILLTSRTQIDWKRYKNYEKKLNQQQNNKLTNIFIEFYVTLFGDLYEFISTSSKSFNKKKYLESHNESELAFFQQIVETSLFDCFMIDLIDNYVNSKNDTFSEKLQEINTQMYFVLQMFDKKNKSFLKIYQLPELSAANSSNFISDCIDSISDEIESSNLLDYKDCLHYLRGLFLFCIGHINESLQDFYKIESKELFPKQLLTDEIWSSLNYLEKESILKEDFYKHALDFKKMEDAKKMSHFMHQKSMSLGVVISDFETLEILSFNEFSQKLDMLEIRIDIDTTHRLFNALTLGESNVVSLNSFEIFIDTYQAKDDDLRRLNKYLPINKLRTLEFALKVSNSTVVPNVGIGRVALTQKCLYFLEQGTNKRKLITDLKNIRELEKEAYKMFQVCIKIITNQDKVIYLPIQEERNIWYLLIQELCSAIFLSHELKDPSLPQYAAKNVLLIDSVFRSGLESRTTHSKDLQKAVETMCSYSYQATTNHSSTDAKRILHLRLNPFSREYQKYSIETMVHVSNDQTLWCGIGNRIKIYESITLSGEIDDIIFDSKITCLMHEPSQSKIWMGTIDNSIYVIDVVTRSINKKITKHSDVVLSISIFEKFNLVVTSAANGELVTWNPNKLEMVEFCKLKDIMTKSKCKLLGVITSKEYLICNNSTSLIFLDENFNMAEKIEFKICENPEQISCMCISYNSEDDEELVWAGGNNGFVCVWSLKMKNFLLKMRIQVDGCQGIRTFIFVNDLIWAGSKDGKLNIFCAKSFECEKSFVAHCDTVRSLCFVDKYIVSGSGSKDGTLAAWHLSRVNRNNITSSIKKMLETNISKKKLN